MDSPFGPVPLSPISFLERAAVHGDRVGMVDDGQTFTYNELWDRCARTAALLRRELGLVPGDRVSVLSLNTHALLEAHFALPMARVVLNALNTRLSAAELGYIIGHAGSRVLIVDHELEDLGRAAVVAIDEPVTGTLTEPVRIIVAGRPSDELEALLRTHTTGLVEMPKSELDLLSINYTSGTTGRPKGVMYSHRGAFLQAVAMAAQAGIDANSVFLWTLPMFHCNGWCYPWAVTAVGGRHIGLRRVEPTAIWDAIRNGDALQRCANSLEVDRLRAVGRRRARTDSAQRCDRRRSA